MPLVSLESLQEIEVNRTTSSALYGLDAVGGVLQLLSKPAPRPYVSRSEAWFGSSRIRYTDPWGELIVDAPFNVQVGPAPEPQVRLTGASAMAFAGQAACVSGSFPTLSDAYGLMFDGMTELPVWGASQTAVMVGIPEAATPGPHSISTRDGSSSVTVGVLTVEASLDQNRLWRGQSTTLRLRVLGTDRQFPIRLLNRTPQVVTVDGGVQQTLTTSGGAENAVTRNVNGIRRGDFTITYVVSAQDCGAGA
jgi:hypothetical protein